MRRNWQMKLFGLATILGSIASAGVAGADVVCVGDCDGTGETTIAEIRLGVEIALGVTAAEEWPAFRPVPMSLVTVADLIRGVLALDGDCTAPTPGPATPTPSSTTAATPTLTPGTPVAPTPTSPPVTPAHFCDLPGSVQ